VTSIGYLRKEQQLKGMVIPSVGKGCWEALELRRTCDERSGLRFGGDKSGQTQGC